MDNKVNNVCEVCGKEADYSINGHDICEECLTQAFDEASEEEVRRQEEREMEAMYAYAA